MQHMFNEKFAVGYCLVWLDNSACITETEEDEVDHSAVIGAGRDAVSKASD